MGLTSQSLRPSSERSEEEPAEQYLVSVMGPGASLGPQACLDLDAVLECVKDNIENGSVVTVARVKGQV